jgi:hypothetical protein
MVWRPAVNGIFEVSWILVRTNGFGKEFVEFVVSLGKPRANMIVELLVVEERLLAQCGFKVHQIKDGGVFSGWWVLLISIDGAEVVVGSIG